MFKPCVLASVLDNIEERVIPQQPLKDLQETVMSISMLEIQKELLAMDEWKVLARIRHFNMSIRLLERNADELLKIITFLTDDPNSLHLTNVKRRVDLDSAFEDVIRLLHNFVASVLSLVDHTRVFYRELYEKTAKFPDYNAEITKRLAEAPLVQFVLRLRQFSQHYRLPEIGFTLNYNHETGITRYLYLVKSDLQSFDGWNAPAKIYLNSAPDQIGIRETVTSYLNEIRDFYKWIAERQRQIHASDVAAVEAKQAEAHQKVAKEIPTFIKVGLEIYRQGIGSLCDAFAFGLSPEEHFRLSPYEGDLPEWVRRAIEILRIKFGPLPDDLLTSIQELIASEVSKGVQYEPKPARSDSSSKTNKNKNKRIRQKATRKKNRSK